VHEPTLKHYRNLTQREIQALAATTNVSDGHPRQQLTAAQTRIIDQLPELYRSAVRAPFQLVERSAIEAFFACLRQFEGLAEDVVVISCYSSSTAMTLVARCLAELDERVALIHPTFDNVPDLLRAAGIALTPISEVSLARNVAALEDADVTAVFMTVPNNPTGWILSPHSFEALVESCVQREILVLLDASFRGFDTRVQFDMYSILRRSGADFAVIEDSGKLWPVAELKLGFVATFGRLAAPLRDAASDLLLSVSPFLLALIESLARDAANGGFRVLHKLIADNRQLLTARLSAAPSLRVLDAGSRVSVTRIELPPHVIGEHFITKLRALGVHALPCQPFYWAQPEEGEHLIRIALARDPRILARAADALVDVVETLT
jgi:aspartate/methionine/tyrosine aminotransferase